MLPTHSSVTVEQITEIFHLGAECQALGTQLTKQFQTLSGLEVMYHTAAQATTHKTINTGSVGRGAAYSVLMNGGNSDKKHEETLQTLCEEADKAWEDTNNVVFNHQLRYDTQLVSFIASAKKTLQEKIDEVWEHVQSLLYVAGIPQDVCLCLALQVLELLPTIPIDLSFCTSIPMMLAYGPESYMSHAWLEDGGKTSSLGKKAKTSHLVKKKLEQLGQEREREDRSSGRSASPACPYDSSVHGSPSAHH